MTKESFNQFLGESRGKLNQMNANQLVIFNKVILDLIRTKRNQEIAVARATLHVGQRVKWTSRRGSQEIRYGTIYQINRKTAHVEEEVNSIGNLKPKWRIHMSLLSAA